MANGDAQRLAVLIDADNASATVASELLEEAAKYGTATVKRAYGDRTKPNLGGWKEHLHRHAIQPIQQFAYTWRGIASRWLSVDGAMMKAPLAQEAVGPKRSRQRR